MKKTLTKKYRMEMCLLLFIGKFLYIVIQMFNVWQKEMRLKLVKIVIHFLDSNMWAAYSYKWLADI